MSEQDTTTTTSDDAATAPEDTAQVASGPQETGQGEQGEKDSSDSSRGLRADLVKERRQRQALEKQLKEIEDAKLSDLERLQRQAKEATDRAEKAERSALRQQVAIKHQLTPDLAKRLQGETEDELDADGAELAKLLAPKGPRPDLTQGSRADRSGPVDMNQLIRSAARRG